MGNCASLCASPTAEGNEEDDKRLLRLIIIGLNNAGKTTISHAMRGEHPPSTTPTWGFNSYVGRTKAAVQQCEGQRSIDFCSLFSGGQNEGEQGRQQGGHSL